MGKAKVERALVFMDNQMQETSLRLPVSINQMVLHYSILDHQIKIWVDTQLVDLMIEVVLALGEAISKDLTVAQIMLE